VYPIGWKVRKWAERTCKKRESAGVENVEEMRTDRWVVCFHKVRSSEDGKGETEENVKEYGSK
jgi:hypothetical protein